MRTFKAYFKKEILESIRQYRYIVLTVGIIFFAISDPIMMKLLPEILKNQTNADLSSLFVITRRSVLQNYVKDLFQIGTIFIVFTLSGSLSDEITNQKFVFPYAKGGSPTGIVLSKILHYGVFITLITFFGFGINYYYINILIKGDTVPFTNVMLSAGLISLYYFFNVTLATFFSSIIKKGIVSGFIVLGIGYFSVLLNNLKAVNEFIPYKLISNANLFTSINATKTVISIALYCFILIGLTIYRMNKVEVI